MPVPEQKLLTATLSGPFDITGPNGASLLPKSLKARGILGYLCFNHGKPIPRSTLIDLFWADRENAQGQASLRQAMVNIRRSLGDDAGEALRNTRSMIILRSDLVAFDLWSEDGTLDPSLSARLLDGLDPVSPVFDDWLEDTRREILAAQLRAAQAKLETTDAAAAPEDVIALATVVLKLDPINEVASRAMQAAFHDLGQMSAVKREFERLERALKEDDLEVSTSTIEHYRTISSNRRAAATRITVAEMARAIPILALTPAALQTETPETATVRDMLAEECLIRLAQLAELQTIEMPSDADIADNADYWLQTRIANFGGMLTISFRLALVQTGILVWTGREQIDADRLLYAVSAVCARMISAVLPAIERREYEKLRAAGGAPQGAYDHYVLSKHLFFQAEGHDYMLQVQRHLEAGLDLDPMFEPAYVHLIQAYNTGSFMTRPGVDMTQGRARALALSEQLLAINSKHSSAHIAMGWCQLWKENYFAAERSIEMAISLGAYEPHRLNAIGHALLYLGRIDEAESFFDRASEHMLHELDYQRTDYGQLQFFRRDFERALAWLDFSERRTPYRTLIWRALTYAQIGRLADARADIDAIIEDVRPRWQGRMPFDGGDVVRWYTQIMPIRRTVDRDLVADSIAKAGIIL